MANTLGAVVCMWLDNVAAHFSVYLRDQPNTLVFAENYPICSILSYNRCSFRSNNNNLLPLASITKLSFEHA
jgi:hypothetical protein